MLRQKKKDKAWARFSHSMDLVFNMQLLYFKGNIITQGLKREILYEASECAVMSEFAGVKKCTPNEAFTALSCEAGAIIVAIGNWLIVKPEYEGGKKEYYVLRK